MRPDPHAAAIASVVRDLIGTREGTTYFVEKISGIALRYKLEGNHPLIGRSSPDFEFENGTRLGTLLHDGKALLVDFAGNQKLRVLSQGWGGRLKYVSAKPKDTKGSSALFVRPDGFVAWAADQDPDCTEARAAITHWLGNAAYSGAAVQEMR
ncbi:MAG TPA: hypothetical protein VFB14_13105 [Bryobacteraceae bacterium]|jgi:hypothetical protein|nr:hypothetical protein [Bryobacteraceae bacterium]